MKPGVGASSLRRDCRTYIWLQARSPLPACSQAALEQRTSVTHACQGLLPAFGMLWEGMVEAAWRGLL